MLIPSTPYLAMRLFAAFRIALRRPAFSLDLLSGMPNDITSGYFITAVYSIDGFGICQEMFRAAFLESRVYSLKRLPGPIPVSK